MTGAGAARRILRQSTECSRISRRSRRRSSAFLLGTTALVAFGAFQSHPAFAGDLDVGQLTPGQTYDVTGTESYANFYVGNGTNEIGTVNVLGGALLNTGIGDSILGNSSGSSGTVTISGSGSKWTATGSSDGVTLIGNSGSGTLEVTNGGTAEVDRIWSAMESGSSSTFTVEGSGSSLHTGDLLLGYSGTANATISNGALLETNGTSIGGWNYADDATGSGSLTVTGAGTTWTENGGVDVGRGGNGSESGTLTISDGATATNVGGLYGQAGATVSITGKGTSLTIGDKTDVYTTSWFSFGGGDITLSDGAYLYSDGGYIGGNGTDQTTMTISGPGTTWDTTQRIYIAGDTGGDGAGYGTVTVSDGASISSATIGVGMDVDSIGKLTLTGAGTTATAFAVPELSAPGNFYVAYAGTGTVTISDGAALTVANELRIATDGAGTGTLNIGAAEGDAAAAPGSITAPKIVFGDGDGTIVFNHTASDFVLSPDVTGYGTLKALAGTTSLTGDYSGFTGDVTVEGGKLSVDTSSFVGAAFAVSGGTLAVNGAVSGVATTVTMSGGTLVNNGSISGTDYGVVLSTAGNEITTSGAISGGTASIRYGVGGNQLNIMPTASFGSLVDFNNTTGNTTTFGTGSYSIPVALYASGGNTVQLNNSRQSVIYDNAGSASGTINVVDVGAGALSSATTQTITNTVGLVMTDILSLDVERNGPVYGGPGSGGALGYADSAPESKGNKAITKMVGDGLAVDRYGNLVWMRAFGGQRFDTDIGSTAGHYGLAAGVDHAFGGDRVGVMAGYGRLANEMDDASSKVDGDTYFGGLYGRHDFGAGKLDASLIAGGIASTSERSINSGAQTATGSYGGWFFSPEVAVSRDQGLGSGWMFTPKGVVRYTHGSFDGYSEHGSSQNITYQGRSSDVLQAALELKVTRWRQLADGQSAGLSLTGTVEDTYNMGDSKLNASLQGTDFTVASSEARNVVGGKLGASAELRVNSRTTLFAGARAGLYSDQSWDYAANAGLKLKF